MANRGYSDNDGSRDPAGIHDEGCKTGVTYSVDPGRMMSPTTVAQMQTNDNPIQGYGDIDGAHQKVTNAGWPVDGRTGNINVAAYPPKPEDPNAQD